MSQPYITSTQVATSTPYDDSQSIQFNASNVQEAFDSIKVSLASTLFVKNYIENNSIEYLVPVNFQYMVFDELTMDGSITVDGALILLG